MAAQEVLLQFCELTQASGSGLWRRGTKRAMAAGGDRGEEQLRSLRTVATSQIRRAASVKVAPKVRLWCSPVHSSTPEPITGAVTWE